MRVSGSVMGVATGVLLLALPARGYGQDLPGLHLLTPGARAQAMGATFIAVADDATAAISNPAGIRNLTRPQIYVEFSSTNAGLAFDAAGGETQLRLNSISFLSGSTSLGSRITVAGTRYEFLNFTDRFTPGGDEGGVEDITFRGVSYGGTAAVDVGNGLRLGATLSADQFRTGFAFAAFSETEWGAGIALGGLWQANDRVSVGLTGGKGSESASAPTHFGGGVSVRPSSRFLAAVDLVRIGSGIDLTEVHAGGEFSIPQGANQLFLRAGAFGAASDESEEDHGATFGAGYTVGQRFQLDFAFVTKDRRAVLSSAVRF